MQSDDSGDPPDFKLNLSENETLIEFVSPDQMAVIEAVERVSRMQCVSDGKRWIPEAPDQKYQKEYKQWSSQRVRAVEWLCAHGLLSARTELHTRRSILSRAAFETDFDAKFGDLYRKCTLPKGPFDLKADERRNAAAPKARQRKPKHLRPNLPKHKIV
jgi:hypothetical protein